MGGRQYQLVHGAILSLLSRPRRLQREEGSTRHRRRKATPAAVGTRGQDLPCGRSGRGISRARSQGGLCELPRVNGTSAPADSNPSGEAAGKLGDPEIEWESGDNEQAPPEEETETVDVDDPDGAGPMLVNTTTGELVGAGA